ncbi:MAG: putative Ig domain-containing protein [Bryobacterales bacterium]|nr:putative Ig domain-containing protein [Bryobacterales bacterium]
MTFPVTVTVGGLTSNASTFTVIGDTTITIGNESNLGTRTAGTAFNVDLEATGGNGNYTWSLAQGSTLPPGLSLNASSGLLDGTLGQAGAYAFTIRVVDNASPGQASGQKTFNLVVQDFVVSTTSLPQARIGLVYSAPLAFAGGPTAPAADYTWTLVSGVASLPGGITFNTATGTFAGVPEPIGSPTQTFNVQVSARHTPTGLATPPKSLQLVVSGGGLDLSPTSLPFGVVNQPYGPGGAGVTVTPINGTAPYTFDLNQTQVNQLTAAGFVVRTRTDPSFNPPYAVSITGTPTISGSFPLNVTVRDAGNTQVTRTLTVLVLANPLSIQPETLPGATVNADYTQQLTLSGVSAEEQNVQPGQSVVTWSLQGNIPGLSLNQSTGILSGRFTTTGARQFTVQASTRLRDTVRVYTLSVGGPQPSISTTTLPAAQVGQNYSAEITAIGGTPGYSWQVGGITLPGGLSFDGTTVNSSALRIIGTVAQGAQTRTFTLTVQDSTGLSASREFTIAVSSTPIPAVTLQTFANPLPAEQKDVIVRLAQPYPLPLQGTATLTFTPNATNNADDPAVRFLNGQRTANFSIPANNAVAVFEGVPTQRVQTGTVAGTARVQVAITNGPTTSQEFTISRSAPFLQDNLTVQTTPGGFSLVITGYSTPRDLSSARVTFAPTAGTNLQTTELTIPLTTAATQWFQGAPGQANGGAFRLTIPFTVQNGTNAVASVTVTLSNSVGTSNARTRAF